MKVSLTHSNSMRIPMISVFFLCSFLFYTTTLSAITYYVKPAGDDTKNGMAWDMAFKTLTKALDVANSGDQIWVAAGTYYPDEGPGTVNEDRASSFVMKEGVAIYGGFNGTETMLMARNWTTNVCILSGEIQQDGTDTNNAYHVIKNDGNGLTAAAILDGFIIKKGYATDADPNDRGAGMFNVSVSPKVVNCTFDSNTADRGGGMYNHGSSPEVTNCTFSQNAAFFFVFFGSGGGVFSEATSNGSFVGCTFSMNMSSEEGGGISLYSSNPTITNCTFSMNMTCNSSFGKGGGMRIWQSSPMITGCTFTENESCDTGGGISIESGSHPTISKCVFKGNKAESGSGGLLLGNGGGLEISDGSNPTVTNCAIWGNKCARGGAILVNSSSPTITNCSISGNRSIEDGGSIFNSGAGTNSIITNCIIWGNDAETGEDEIFNTFNGTCTVSHCIVEGGYSSGTNVIDQDPLFVTPPNSANAPTTAGDLHIEACSPAKDMGTAANAPTDDFDGDMRPQGTAHDIGYDENNAPCVTCPPGMVAFVDKDATGANNGTSWTDAYTDLQDALALINGGTCPSLNEIWVAEGTYKPTSGTDRTLAFIMLPNVGIYGGFVGTETMRSQRNWTANVTILSGDIGAAGNTDNSYNVIRNDGNNLTNTAILDGFTVTGGNANDLSGNPIAYSLGGGMYNLNSSPNVSNCIFSDGNAFSGGGIYASNSNSTISNCTFTGNGASLGGGMRGTNFGGTITSCIFTTNNSTGTGAGLYINGATAATVTKCTFTANSGVYTAGMDINGNATQVINCSFSGNKATVHGGGLTIQEGGSGSAINCSFSGNSAPNGGGFFTESSIATLTNCIFWGNSSEIYNDPASSSTLNVTYSIVQGGFTGTGNLDQDPLFVIQPAHASAPTTAGDLHLEPCSPAKDAGTGTGAPNDDFDGDMRPQGSGHDMGFDENNGTCMATCPPANVVFVDKDATGANNGTSWTDAYTDLQDALGLISGGTCPSVNQIWVAEGTYTPTSGTDRNISFVMLPNVGIFGGFVGTETMRSQRNWSMNATILSGEIGAAGNADNSYHVVANINNSLTSSSTLDGFIIGGGNANGPSGYQQTGGGGMLNENSSPIVSNCIFSGNEASLRGGGVYNVNSTMTFSNCAVFGNKSGSWGGGAFIQNNTTNFVNCSFSGNSAPTAGGIYDDGGGNVTVKNSILWGNSSEFHSGSSIVTYSIVQGGYAGTGNLDQDPLFVNQPAHASAPTMTGDLHLQPCSPAKDAGTAFGVPDRDFDDETRPQGSAHDMGFDENNATCTPTCPPGMVVFVDKDATGANNGTSWTDAYTDLQDALSLISGGTCPSVNEIWVAEGTYTPTSGTDRNISFVMLPNVGIYGGFVGMETMRSQRNWTTKVTTLSGEIGAAGTADNSYHVVYNDGNSLTSTAILDGFTLTAGMADDLSGNQGVGGGMFNKNSSPTVNNCAFSGNAAISGGGLWNENSSPMITDCSFSGNMASANGGGMYNIDGSSPAVNGCSFSNNTAKSGGGMYNNSSSPMLTNCSFTGNTVTFYGGGLANDFSSSPTIRKCSFSGNSANMGGGGMYNIESSPAVINCSFSGNLGNSIGGGMYNTDGALSVTNCSFSGNSATNGGGINNNGTTLTVTNCILWGNSSEIENSGGTVNATYSIVQGGYTGTGNLDQDPLFVNQPAHASAPITAGDLHIGDCSPAKDAGTATGAPATDFDGDARPIGNGFDMGFDENTSTASCCPSGTVVYVDKDATGINTGQSWADAFTDLQDALALISGGGCPSVNEIWVAEGTYKPTSGTDRTASFVMLPNVGIFGGFNGTETMRFQRNWTTNVTILSGEIGANGNADNTYNIVRNDGNNLTNTAVLDGFTISYGNANAGSGVSSVGSGMFNKNSSPKVENCIFSNNMANFGGAMFNEQASPEVSHCTFTMNGHVSFGGGGMTNITSSPSVTDCTFSNNVTQGMYNEANSTPTVTDCTFSGNTKSGIYINDNSNANISNCTFTGNSDSSGGGMYINGSAPTVDGCTFTNNSASGDGGGIFMVVSSVTITNTTFDGNTASGGSGEGGGISTIGGSPTISGCTFTNNSATRAAGALYSNGSNFTITNTLFESNSTTGLGTQGGAAYFLGGNCSLEKCQFKANVANASGGGSGIGGAIYYEGGIFSSVNCIFSGNKAATQGGAFFARVDSPLLTNCSFSGNSATQGGAVFNDVSNVKLKNCILWGNSSEVETNFGTSTVTYSIVQGGHAGTGNLNFDPLFVNQPAHASAPTTVGDLHIGNCSPAKDAGTATGAPADDFDGDARPFGAGIDMGFDENTVNANCCPPSSIVYVNHAAGGANNGASWTDAYTDLQAAINSLANSNCLQVTEIWVAKGTYKPTSGTNRNATFSMLPDLDIYGGFSGTETMRSQRNWMSNLTVLSGDIGASGNNSDNSYHVIYNNSNGVNAGSILDGFTISGGNADPTAANRDGAGMVNDGASPTINNCIFENNYASSTGGAVCNDNFSNTTFNNCVFQNNSANNDGGAMSGFNNSQAVLDKCLFLGNSANFGRGGGLSNHTCSPTITNCGFSGNKAQDLGGAIANLYASSPTVMNCSFSGNFGGQGGAIYNLQNSNPTVTNSVLWGNNSEIVNSGSTPNVSYCTVQGGYPNGSNIFTQDPLFVNQPVSGNAPTMVGDLHLQSCSPAKNKGTNAGAPMTDFDGQSRPQDNAIDLGFDEAPFTSCCAAPVANCQNSTVTLVGNSVTLQPSQVNNGSTSACGLQSLSVLPDMFDCSHVGIPQTVTLTVTDVNGQSSNCNAIVTVQDNTLPTITCPANQTVAANANCDGSLMDYTGMATVNDNCTPTGSLNVTQNPVVGTVISNTQTVTLTVDDGMGNTNNCTFDVAIQDNTPPTIGCQNINVSLGNAGSLTLLPAQVHLSSGSSDNCGTVNLVSVSPNTFDCSNSGPNTVTLTGNDGNGNNGTCTATVTISGAVVITGVTLMPENCGQADGQITINATGPGGGQLRYSIDGGTTFQLSNTFNNLQAGTFNVVVELSGNSNCSATSTATVVGSGTIQTWYRDVDNDGYSNGVTQQACNQPTGFKLASQLTATSGDCNDNDAMQFPGQVWWKDADSDGYGDGNSLIQCAKPVGYVTASQLTVPATGTGVDCNDGDANINPGASEICNGVDDNCNGQVDEGATGGLTFVGNVLMSNQADVDNFSQCYSKIDGNLTIKNSGVNSLANLINLVEVTGNVYIKSTSLTSMNGLDNLVTIGGFLRVESNNSLTTLDGLEKVTSVGSYLRVYRNNNLSDCCAIHDLLSNNGVGGSITIARNKTGCDSVSQINTACAGSTPFVVGGGSTPSVSSSDLNVWIDFQLSPNPADHEVWINISGQYEKGKLRVMDTGGRLIKSLELEANTEQLNLEVMDWNTGIYFVQLSLDREILTKRLVIK